MLKPASRMHFLCASISAEQFSSPFSTMLEEIRRGDKICVSHVVASCGIFVGYTHQASRALLVSGQAQQALQVLGFSPAAGTAADAVATG
ncbi:hypothetical protein M5D96_013809 [Drosophila gunungcola]|uniref:Uncharacterized protein n=1 Tax=Drosophila gunungcola TaxID=103775 RepID=A0A9P9YAP6_9MUSC|nr:hypothetical protein M5D96_013809 [Drosophila gunungcola]